MPEPIVAAQDVAKVYQLGKTEVHALRHVDLVVERGEFLSIAGPSGSGKTTLLNLIGGVDVPSSGTVHVDGEDTSKLTERALTRLRLDHIGFIFQTFNLVAVMAGRRRRVNELLESVGLASHSRHRPSELSGGQRQRVAVARALVARPPLVLADEPTANLDSKTGGTIIDLMREMNLRDGTTFIFSTHDPKVMAHASAIVRLEDGCVVGRESLQGVEAR
jgi:putative ABC transport system ATP-binding protein